MQIWQIKERYDLVSSLHGIKRINVFNIIKKDMVKYNDLYPLSLCANSLENIQRINTTITC